MTDTPNQALTLALRLLAIRPRSESEIRTRLSQKFSTQTVAEVLEKLKSDNLINDSQFASWLVESRSRSRPKAIRVLKRELAQKGIDQNLIDESVMSIDELELAQKLLEKKMKIWSGLSRRDLWKKSVQFLSFRGFSYSVIEKALKSLS